MKLQKDKLRYSVVHGMAPFFHHAVVELIKKVEHLVIGFDESLNHIAQKQQMDAHVRLWDHEKNEVTTRYYSSVFLSSSKAVDLKNGLKEIFGEFMIKLLQFSMDGPNVNKKTQDLVNIELSQDRANNSEIVEIGTCGLHTVHGSFKDGVKATGWNLNEYLNYLHHLFHGATTRRGQYSKITGSDMFPFEFYGIRWIENSKVIIRSRDMLPYLKEWITVIEKDVKNPLHANKNFRTVSSNVKDELMPAKLSFCASVAAMMEPFLTEFQSDAPMAPFLYKELERMARTIMRRFVKREILEKIS
ncbi:hypothetical protein QAD02_013980 [Eretmocerus hayati]|uniref:Uncharacterized protein n=1 Tax=Eretmocerus hayati TaxID=131215 RepID=A0ACC2P525_9HYME|nr:hypothetical protein QAD02_013980 [Eretmocerus hayati]